MSVAGDRLAESDALSWIFIKHHALYIQAAFTGDMLAPMALNLCCSWSFIARFWWRLGCEKCVAVVFYWCKKETSLKFKTISIASVLGRLSGKEKS